MKSMLHTAELKGKKEDVLDILVDVNKWPNIFPPCRAATVLKQDCNEQIIEITASANGTPMTWKSKRRLDIENGVIEFEQIETSSLLKCMKGVWRVFDTSYGTLVSLEHQFEISDTIRHNPFEIRTRHEAEKFISSSVDNNSRSELASIKRNVEDKIHGEFLRANKYQFKESVMIKASALDVYNFLWDAELWPKILPHCSDMKVLYNDGANQELVMEVAVQGGKERIRTIRHKQSDNSIKYFQPAPPPVLRAHTGEWLIESVDDGVRVISSHEVQLAHEGVRRTWGDIDEHEAIKRVSNAINGNSRMTLDAARTILERSIQGGNKQ